MAAQRDFANGYNNGSRAEMISNVQKWFPDLTCITRLMYASDGRLFCVANGRLARTVPSIEGSWQGDALGYFHFEMSILNLMISLVHKLWPDGAMTVDLSADAPRSAAPPESLVARAGYVWIADDLVLVARRCDIVKACMCVLEEAPKYGMHPAAGKLTDHI